MVGSNGINETPVLAVGVGTTPVFIRKLSDEEVQIWSFISNVHFRPLTETRIKDMLQKTHDEHLKECITKSLEIRGQRIDIDDLDTAHIDV